jgi:hypothetical protein
MKKKCPNCNSDKHLKKILYGMPGDSFDFTKYHVGGCMPGDSTVHCSNCGWEDDMELTEKAWN